MTEGTWNMLLIAVHPDYQNSGRGAALVAHLETVLRTREARLIIVETSGFDEFEQARRFYRKLGYAEEAQIREFYAPGEDKLVFVKAL
jgi:ribosomal protein S18 acetylase RimI-like enzyme